MKSGLYKITGDYCSVTEPISSSKALSKAKVAPKERSWSLLVVCYQLDPLPLSESWRNYYI